MYLFIGGLVLSFVSFAGALLNFFTVAADGNRSFASIVGGHLGAMLGMAFGGLLSVVGVVMMLMDFLK